ncbi:MAG: hypothetical protein AAGE89_05355, partial [Pseudomonadota bacterium]
MAIDQSDHAAAAQTNQNNTALQSDQEASRNSLNASETLVAQATGDTGSPVTTTDQSPDAQTDPSVPTFIAPNADNVVELPATVSFDNARIENGSLYLTQPDGSVIVIENAAANLPTFVIAGIELPREALQVALAESG